MEYKERIALLEEQLREKRHLETKIRLLQKEEKDLRDTMDIYARQAAEEKADVEELTGWNLKALAARLQKNTYKDTLTREQAEAAAAAAKYEDAKARLEAIAAETDTLTRELRQVKMAEREYRHCLEERLAWLGTQSGKTAQELTRLETEAEELRQRKRELEEALTAGKRVKTLAAQIDRELAIAENWGAWDAMANHNSIYADGTKYDHLDRANKMSQSLQKLINDFHSELDDVSLYTELTVEIDALTRFADFFWDSIFVDTAVLERIRGARWRAEDLEAELEPMLADLQNMVLETEKALAGNAAEVQRLAEEA